MSIGEDIRFTKKFTIRPVKRAVRIVPSRVPMILPSKRNRDSKIEKITHLTVAELSEMVNLSPSRFFTVFKKETGMTPIEYKNHICVNNAQKMLLADNLSIEEIGESLGFNSASYFRRTFKKYVGKSPREYRNNINSDFKI